MAQIKDTTELYNFLIDLDPTFGDDKTVEEFEVDMQGQQYQQQISDVTRGERTPPTKENHLFGIDEVLAEIPTPPIPYSPPVPQDAFTKKPFIISENIINTPSIKTPLGVDEVEIETEELGDDPETFAQNWLSMSEEGRKSILESSPKFHHILTNVEAQTITDLGELNTYREVENKVKEIFNTPMNKVNKLLVDWDKQLKEKRKEVENSTDQQKLDEYNAELRDLNNHIEIFDYLSLKHNELFNDARKQRKLYNQAKGIREYAPGDKEDKEIQWIYRDKEGNETLWKTLSYNDIYKKHLHIDMLEHITVK